MIDASFSEPNNTFAKGIILAVGGRSPAVSHHPCRQQAAFTDL